MTMTTYSFHWTCGGCKNPMPLKEKELFVGCELGNAAAD
jgi:hypothetical protein